jgi:tRNA U34 5-methylaminomethyl-2-thiouridine-forming methyltransferase MnmC
MHPQLKTTLDGSHTLYSPAVEECYHSQNGAIQESEHIFIKTGWENCEKTDLKVFEVGFGTGLNAFLTLLQAEKEHKKVHYTSLEYYPLSSEIAEKLNYFELLDKEKKADFHKLHLAEWNKTVEITPFFSLEKIQTDFTLFEPSGFYDLFYFDAFSPEKQPEIWTQERFAMLYVHANPDAVLVTYCAKGIVRRALQTAGFKTERLPGPPGKREILRARK